MFIRDGHMKKVLFNGDWMKIEYDDFDCLKMSFIQPVRATINSAEGCDTEVSVTLAPGRHADDLIRAIITHVNTLKAKISNA